MGNVATGGRAISELERMPETSVAFTQGSLVVQEYGNSIPWAGKLEELSEFDVENIWLRTLRDDAAKTLDTQVANQFVATQLTYTPTGTDAAPTNTFHTDGTLGTAARNISTFDVKEIVDNMKNPYLVPFYDGENYMAIVSVKAGRRIKDDPDFEDAVKYGDPERLFTGEIGRYYGVRFVEETHFFANTFTNGTAYNGPAVFFGADPVIEGIVVPLEMRAKIPTDYGRDKGLAWYFLGGWQITFSTANNGEVKICYLQA